MLFVVTESHTFFYNWSVYGFGFVWFGLVFWFGLVGVLFVWVFLFDFFLWGVCFSGWLLLHLSDNLKINVMK